MRGCKLDLLIPVIGRIYEAVPDPRLWGEVVSAVVDVQRATKVLLFSLPLSLASE